MQHEPGGWRRVHVEQRAVMDGPIDFIRNDGPYDKVMAPSRRIEVVETWQRYDEWRDWVITRTTVDGRVVDERTEARQMATMYTNSWSNSSASAYTVTYDPTFYGDAVANKRKRATAIPNAAEYIPECIYGGTCAHCAARIEVGSPIWWHRGSKSRIWCGKHRAKPAAPADGTDHEKEHDMAQRFNFTFPYTGAEIAAGLEAQAAKLEADAEAIVSLDAATLEVLYSSEVDRREIVKQQDSKREKLTKAAAKLRTEAKPYEKAGKQSFDLDLEDVEHFGLDKDDAPARKVRKVRASKPAEDE